MRADPAMAERSGVAFVAARDRGSEVLLENLAAELPPEGAYGSPGETRLMDGPATALEGCFGRAAALVYAAGARSSDPREPTDPADARAVLTAAVEAGVPRVVLLSSTEAIAPSHHHPGLLSEDRFQPRPGDNRWSTAWRAVEDLAEELAERDAGIHWTVLRAAPVPVAGGGDFFSRLLGRPLALTVPGFDPPLQLLAPEDLARALSLALVRSGGEGHAGRATPRRPRRYSPTIYHIVPRGAAPLHRVIRLSGGHRLPVPRWLQRFGRWALAPTGRIHAAVRVDFLRYPWTAAGDRAAAELGFDPRRSTVQVARSLRPGGPSPERHSESDAPDAGAWEWSTDAAGGGAGFDDFGMDRAYVARYGRTLLRFLHDLYWRVEVRGLEHVPRTGRGVLTGVHRGFMPFDGVMALHLLVRETGRYPRFLLHPTLTKFPFLANFMTKLGGVLACRENADWVLERGGLVGVYPEGIRGAFTPYRRAYRLGRFGRDEYVRIALRNRAPIIPFVTVGSAEIFPILGRVDWRWWKRFSEWPYLPITPTFPLLPLPLPSKWHTRILEPLRVEERHPPEAANDPRVVRAISWEVRRRMAGAIDEMLARRRSIYFGSVFEELED